MSTTIKLRGGIAANWASVNPVLAEREMVVETDTYKIKIGDGTTAYNSLEYITSGAPTTNVTGGANNYAPIINPVFSGFIKGNNLIITNADTDDEIFLVDNETKTVSIFEIQEFADNTAAAALPANTIYKTPTGVLMIKY